MATGKYAGIGSIIRYHKKHDRVIISEPYENTPSQDAGLKAGDIILTIDGKDIKGLMPTKVTEMLRGEAGTTLELKFQRPGEKKPRIASITRSTIQLPSIPYYGILDEGIGYLNLSSFTAGCAREMRHALLQLISDGAKNLVLDLRDNSGGSINEAVDILNLFLPKGEKVLFTKGKMASMNHEYFTTTDPIAPDMPVVVLVNGMSASSSEIVCGALQDLDRAVILGTQTYGKGLVQTLRELPYNSSMKITTAKYYIPSGRCVQAIDYSKRNADGSIARTPDSLTNVFHTAAGREVRDGGGIRPDIEVKMEKTPNILFYLANEDMIFDYATQYVIKHPVIDKVEAFQLTDADYSDFKAMLKKRNFTYDRQSEAVLKKLKEIAEFEGYMESSSEEFAALEKKLQHNLDLELDRFAKEIKPLLAEEIVKRYYFERGAVQETLKDDADLKKALEILQQPEEYKKVLTVSVK
jgi:carboxyl-terminal processing protease